MFFPVSSLLHLRFSRPAAPLSSFRLFASSSSRGPFPSVLRSSLRVLRFSLRVRCSSPQPRPLSLRVLRVLRVLRSSLRVLCFSLRVLCFSLRARSVLPHASPRRPFSRPETKTPATIAVAGVRLSGDRPLRFSESVTTFQTVLGLSGARPLCVPRGPSPCSRQSLISRGSSPPSRRCRQRGSSWPAPECRRSRASGAHARSRPRSPVPTGTCCSGSSSTRRSAPVRS